MKKTKLAIWCNNSFSSAEERELSLLKTGVGEHQLVMFDSNHTGLDDTSRAAMETADVAFGYPSPAAVILCRSLRWIHLHSAGYTSFDTDEIKAALRARSTVVTNSSAVYDEPCAEHLLAMILSLARQLPAALDAQRGKKSWEMSTLRAASRLLNHQNVVILGFGAIARRLAELLHPLQMNVIAVRRHVEGNEPIKVADVARVDELLPIADHVVNTLPANEETENFLNATRLAKLKHGAIVYNIGRGSTLDQDALLRELNAGRIAAAYLDVTTPEPLPSDHPLWRTPNCFITPHSAGGHSNEKERQVHHFLDNLRRFEGAEQLLNRII